MSDHTDQPATHVDVGLVAKAFTMLPLFAAARRGFFAGEGIECAYEALGSPDRVTEALMDGRIEFSPTTPEGALLDRAGGGTLTIIAGWTNKLPFKLIGLPQHSGLESLRGGTIGVSSLTEGTVHVIKTLLARAGLEHPRDYAFEVVGAHPQRWELLQEGRIDAGLQPTPFDHMAVDAGYAVLADPAEAFPDFAFSAVVADARWAAAHEDLTVRILRALLKATDWAFDDPAGAAQVLVEESGTTPRLAELSVRDLTESGAIPRDLQLSRAGLDAVLQAMRDTGALAREAPAAADAYVDLHYLDAARAGLG